MANKWYGWCAILMASLIWATDVGALTTAFSYQGHFTDSAAPQPTYDMQFRLFDAPSGGIQIGSNLVISSVAVVDSVFTVMLDFGANVFSGADRFLQIDVRRNSGEPYTALLPRQQIAASPYAVRTLSAQQADVALDAQKLGGVAANQYVTTSSLGNTVIRNDTLPQVANFNIIGSGVISAQLGVGHTLTPGITIDAQGPIRSIDSASTSVIAQTTGGTNSWARFSAITPSQHWTWGTSQDFNGNQFYLVDATIDQFRLMIQPAGGAVSIPYGNVGIGTTNPLVKMHVASAGVVESSTQSTNERAILSLNSTLGGVNRVWTLENGLFGTAGLFGIYDRTAGQGRLMITPSGNVGIGNASPNARLAVETGPTWTSFGWSSVLELPNIGAIGWRNNSSAHSFGIGQTNGGLYFFRTPANPGTNTGVPTYDMAINDQGNIVQNRTGGGFVKAMVYINGDGTLIRCYNGVTGASTGNCGFSVGRIGTSSRYFADFGFKVDDRFWSATATSSCCNVPAIVNTESGDTSNRLWVSVHENGTPSDRPVMLLIY